MKHPATPLQCEPCEDELVLESDVRDTIPCPPPMVEDAKSLIDDDPWT